MDALKKIIEIKKLSFSYKNEKIFENFNLNIFKKQRISFLGESGIGKSTLLKIICGFYLPKIGNVNASENIKISLLFQENSLFSWMTILDNIKFFSDKSNKEIINILKSLHLHGVENKYPNQLSGGMLQRANLACSIASNPEVLLMDEPFSSLDYLTKIENYSFLLNFFKKSDLTTILVSHDINEAILFSEYIYILSKEKKGIKDFLKIDGELNDINRIKTKKFLDTHDLILKKIKENKK
jgi:ABC-type nitrate/sulfonate/bicarbonate transport system ATPase subunit